MQHTLNFFAISPCRHTWRSTLRAITLVCLVPYFSFSFANTEANTIEEVVVTGELRNQELNELATSVVVLRPDDAATQAQHLEEILGRVGNVNFASGASRARFIQVRGIGERGQFAEPLNASVGLLLDGVDVSGIGTAATMFDVAQVEIFRGPQGTLYGANALAGLINVVTPAATDSFYSKVRVDAGNYSSLGIGGVVSGPISDQIGYRVSAQKYADDGFIDNTFLQSSDTDKHSESTFRARLDGTTDDVNWALTWGRVEIDNGYDAFSLENDRTTRSDEPGADRQNSAYVSFTTKWSLTDSVDFEGSFGVVNSDITYGYDEDWTYAGFHPYGYSSTDYYLRDVQTFSADGRWLSRPGAGLLDGTLDWVVGIYVMDRSVDLTRQYTWLSADFESSFDVARTAVYGELSYALAQDLLLSLGLRTEQHQADYDDSEQVAFAPDDNLLGGRILLEKTLTDASLVYGAITQGYKSGGFNTSGSLDADLRSFDPEYLWNYEVGYKSSLLEDRVALRGAVFHMQRRDVQVATSTVRYRDDGSAEFIEYTGNAAKGINQGVELEVVARPTEQLQITANASVLSSEYQDYIDNGGRDLDGREQAHAPGYQFYLAADYAGANGLYMQLALEGKDQYYFSDSHDAQSEAYTLINAAVGRELGPWDVKIWGRNLGDTDYFVRGFYFGNDPRDDYAAKAWTQLGAPQQIGITIQYER